MGSSWTHNPEKYVYPLEETQFKQIKDLFCLSDSNLEDFYEFYHQFDRFSRSYIDFDDFVAYFRHEIDVFVELPYAERLFKCIPKQKENIIFFEQFVRGVSAFCLLNSEALLHFIFDYIDTDGDERISKSDIVKLIEYVDAENGQKTFFTNFIPDLDRFPLKENKTKMDFDHFRLNCDRLMFLTWPAFSLQEMLRERTMGYSFWVGLYGKVEKKEIEIKNNEKKEQRMKEKMQMLIKLKPKMRRERETLLKETYNDRRPGETADDCKLLPRNRRKRNNSLFYKKSHLVLCNTEHQETQA